MFPGKPHEFLIPCLAVLALLPAGCAGGPGSQLPPPPRALGSQYQKFFPSQGRVRAGESRQAPVRAPRGVVTLPCVLALALMGNPRLQAFSWEVRAAEARRIQAGLLPNPEVSLEIEEFGGSGERAAFHGAQTTLTLSQLIQLGGKRSKREKVAALQRDLAGWDYEGERLNVYAETARAFYDLLGAQERLAVAEESLRVAENMAALSARRVRAGKASPLEETKAALQLALGRVALEGARRDLDLARKRLSAAWGEAEPGFETAEGDFRSLLPELPSLETLREGMEANPDLARWKGEMDLRKAALELAEAGRWPDLTLGGGVQRYEGSDDQAFVLQLSLPLMVFDRNQGRIMEAESQLSKAVAERKAALLRAEAALASAYRSLEAAHASALRFEREIIPSAEKAFLAARTGYEGGKFDYLQVLDAQRTLLRVRMEYTGVLSSYHRALVEIERLTAAPITQRRKSK